MAQALIEHKKNSDAKFCKYISVRASLLSCASLSLTLSLNSHYSKYPLFCTCVFGLDVRDGVGDGGSESESTRTKQESEQERESTSNKVEHSVSVFAAVRSQDMESDALCRRLHLADLLSSVFQRVTKYPLLLSSLMKQTQHVANADEELERLRLAETRARDLLARVNHEIRMWENKHFLDHVLRKCAPRTRTRTRTRTLLASRHLFDRVAGEVCLHKLLLHRLFGLVFIRRECTLQTRGRPPRVRGRVAAGALPRPEPRGAAAAALRGRLLARHAARQEGLLGARARARAPRGPPAARVRALPRVPREGLGLRLVAARLGARPRARPRRRRRRPAHCVPARAAGDRPVGRDRAAAERERRRERQGGARAVDRRDEAAHHPAVPDRRARRRPQGHRRRAR